MKISAGPLGQGGYQRDHAGLVDEDGRGLEGVKPGIGQPSCRRPDVFHVDAVDFGNLADEQRHQPVVGQVDEQLIDGTATTPFEDVDADQVTTDRPDPAGNCTQRARPVRHPDPHHVNGHGRNRRA